MHTYSEHIRDASPLHCVVMRWTLGTSNGVDAAVHHTHADPVPGDVEGGSLAPLVGHWVIAAQGTGLCVVLKRQIPAPDLESWEDRLETEPVQRQKTQPVSHSYSIFMLQCFTVYAIHWWDDITGATYSVEQSKQRTGSQTAAWRAHVSQF